MKIEDVSIEKVIPYYNNPKVHNQKLNKLKSSIDRFGFDQPIVVDENYVIIKGHGRRIAASMLGLATVPVLVREGLSDELKRVMRIADNAIFEQAEIDSGIVESEVKRLLNDEVDGLSSFYDLPEVVVEPIATAVKESKINKVSGELITCPQCGSVHFEGD